MPRFWRYWRALPAKGRVGIFHREWTTRAIVDRVKGNLDDAGLDERLRHIENFERALAADGAVVLKFWLHLSESALASRLKDADGGSASPGSHQGGSLASSLSAGSIGRRAGARRTSVGTPWNVVESATGDIATSPSPRP
jgi:hypothetical protein